MNTTKKMDYEKWTKTYTPKTELGFTSQRTNATKFFKNGTIKLQIEGERENIVSLRGKYPNDEWFTTCQFSDIEEKI